MAVDPTGQDQLQPGPRRGRTPGAGRWELLYAGDGSTALVADPDYQKVTHFRTEALAEAVLQATVPWGRS